jgi:undecaprenyl-diphosphatase
MITLLQALILGAVQGLTEFLPVSSSGHLVLLERFFQIKDNVVLLNLMLHLGTVVALIVFFWKDLMLILKQKDWNLVKNLFIAFTTTAIFGFIFKTTVENIFIYNSSLVPLALGFVFTAIVLFMSFKTSKNRREISTLTIVEAVKIGFAQAVAIAPGISRSGLTYFTTIKSGINSKDAFKFSFLLSIPTILAATAVEVMTEYKGIAMSGNWSVISLGLIISFIFGSLGLMLFRQISKNSKLWIFGIYLLVLAGILIF